MAVMGYGPSIYGAKPVQPINAKPASPSQNSVPVTGASPPTTIHPSYQGAPVQAGAAQIGAIPQVSTSSIMGTAGPLGYTPQTSGVDTSAEGFTRALQGGMVPQNAIAQQQLNEQLANAGVIGGGAIGAQQQLNLQENAQFQDRLQSGLLTLKGDELGQSQFNASADNAASQFGITNRLGAATQDASNRITTSADNAANRLSADQTNVGSENAQTNFNISNAIAQAQGNDQIYNNFLAQAQQNQNADWLARLNANTQLNVGSMNNANAAFQPVYQQPAQSNINFSNLGAATAQPAAPKTAPQTPAVPGATGYA